MMNVEFISVNPGAISDVRRENRRKIRIQVMKDFRRKERERQAFSDKGSATAAKTNTLLNEVSRLPPQVHSPALNQVALTQKLRDGWSPVGAGFSTLVPAVVRSWAPVLAILDSTKLLHLGSAVQDERLLSEGRKRFLLTLNCLRSNLDRDPSMALPGLMIVSIGITQCEIYNAVSYESTPITWQKQVIGMSALLLNQRPIDPASGLETFMISRLRTAQLIHSLCTRTPFPVEYKAPAFRSQSPALDFLLDLAFKVPPLLASIDLITSSECQERSAMSITRNLVSLAQMLKNWLKSFGVRADRDHDGLQIREQQLMATSRKSSDDTDAVFDLLCEALCRICLLLIYQGLVDLYGLRSSGDADYHRMPSAAVTCADDLYETVVLLERFAESPVCKAMATRGPLHFLSEWYMHAGDQIGSARCVEMSASVCAKASYLHWDAVLPWSLLPLVKVPR